MMVETCQIQKKINTAMFWRLSNKQKLNQTLSLRNAVTSLILMYQELAQAVIPLTLWQMKKIEKRQIHLAGCPQPQLRVARQEQLQGWKRSIQVVVRLAKSQD